MIRTARTSLTAALAALFVFFASLTAEATTTELRGLWVVRSNLTSPSQIRNVVDEAYQHHFNALFVQARGRGDAYYKSTLEPRAEELSKEPLDFDPLATVISLAHAKGIQVHAWMNTCYVWGDSKPPRDRNHVVLAHPDWIARNAAGSYSLSKTKDCEGAFLTPANLAARQHIHDVFLDVVRNYDVDGIHFDYVRYPNSSYDYSVAALFRFQMQCEQVLSARAFAALAHAAKRDRLAFIHAMPTRWAEFRRQQITEMVRDISRDTKQAKPWVQVTAAVFADSKDAYTVRGQDWKTWLARGYLDAVVPMAYGSSTLLVRRQIQDAVEAAHRANRFVYTGIGSWHIPAQSTIAKIDASRELGAQGSVLFSFGGITKDGTSSSYLNELTAQRFLEQCRPPALPWMPGHSSSSASNPRDASMGEVRTLRSAN